MKTLIPAPALPPLTVALGSTPEGEKLFTLEDVQNLQKSNEELRMFEYYQDMQVRMARLESNLSWRNEVAYETIQSQNGNFAALEKSVKELVTLLNVKYDQLLERARLKRVARESRLKTKNKPKKKVKKNANPGSRTVGKKGKKKGRK